MCPSAVPVSPQVLACDAQHSAELLRTVLGAVSDQVAVLDAQGIIVLVNAAWQQHALDFSPQPGQTTPNSGIGSDYLAVAEAGSSEAAAGLRAVLAGQTDLFSLQYPCHTPDRLRWFTMKVTPLTWAGQRGALVAHCDVTPQNLVL